MIIAFGNNPDAKSFTCTIEYDNGETWEIKVEIIEGMAGFVIKMFGLKI